MRSQTWTRLANTRCLSTRLRSPRASRVLLPLPRCSGAKFCSREHERLQLARFSLLAETLPVVAESTIYALSTAPGRAAIAIIRISGVACANIYHALCPTKRLPSPRYASVRRIYEPSARSGSSNPAIIDSAALVLYFPAPKTVTGEDVLELHVHGGPAVVKAILTAISNCNTVTLPVRYAEPGEFTRRAFLNDRLDLTQVEALGETLSAVTEEQRRVSVQGTGGALAARYESWRHLLLYARGELEALIDFSEDQHFDESPVVLAESVAVQIRSLENRIAYHSANAMRGELLRNGISISLIGAPNVGKSSLLNLIVGRNAAIVSKEAGTTRDVVEIGIDLGGYFCRLGDTAGLRHSTSHLNGHLSLETAPVVGDVEKEGIRRAKEKASQSDVVIVLISVEPSIDSQGAQLSLDPEVLTTVTELQKEGKTIVVVVNKIDNYNPHADRALMTANLIRAIQTVLPAVDSSRIFCISCEEAENSHAHNGQIPAQIHSQTNPTVTIPDPGNIQALLSGLTNTFKCLTAPLIPEAESTSAVAAPTTVFPALAATLNESTSHESLGATQRQRALLHECSVHLRTFLELVDAGRPGKRVAQEVTHFAQEGGIEQDHEHGSEIEIGIDVVGAAESLRAAAECIGKITGRGEFSDVEEVLGVVFEKFCVGK